MPVRPGEYETGEAEDENLHQAEVVYFAKNDALAYGYDGNREHHRNYQCTVGKPPPWQQDQHGPSCGHHRGQALLPDDLRAQLGVRRAVVADGDDVGASIDEMAMHAMAMSAKAEDDMAVDGTKNWPKSEHTPAGRVDRSVLGPADWLAHLRVGTRSVRTLLIEGALEAAVPGCPGWDLRALAWHLGDVQRWACGVITEGHPNTQTAQGPYHRSELLAWYDEGANALLDLLAVTSPGVPCWSFGPTPRTARFWFRRQAHEHAIHAYDARASQRAAESTESTESTDLALALDGIDEVVTMFFPRQVRLQRIPVLERSLAIRPVDGGDQSWVLAGDGSTAVESVAAVDAEAVEVGAADAVVSGPAQALYLLLWRRVGLDDPRLTVEGDRCAAEAVLSTDIVP